MMHIHTAAPPHIDTKHLGMSAEANQNVGSSSNAAHYLSDSTLVDSEASSSSTDANHLAKKYLRGEEPISETEETLFLINAQQRGPQERSEVVHDLDYIEALFATTIKMDVHKKLKKILENASRLTQNYNKAAHSWTKTFLLSKQQRKALKKEVVYASELICYLDKMCADVPGIRNQIDWLKKPRGQLENKQEYKQPLILDERMIQESLFYTEKYITSHREYLEVADRSIKEYMAQTKTFLAAVENLPPEPDIIDRASMFLIALPGLLGTLITGVAYLFGAAGVIAFMPSAIGWITSCLTATLYIINVLKFIPDERVQQNTHQRKQLYTVVFPEILELLKEAIGMEHGAVNRGYDTNYVGGLTLLRKEAKTNASQFKEDTALIANKQDAIQQQINELKQSQPEVVKAIVNEAMQEFKQEFKADFDAKFQSLLEAIKGKA